MDPLCITQAEFGMLIHKLDPGEKLSLFGYLLDHPAKFHEYLETLLDKYSEERTT